MKLDANFTTSEVISIENDQVIKKESLIKDGRLFIFENIYDENDNFIKIRKAYELIKPRIVSVKTSNTVPVDKKIIIKWNVAGEVSEKVEETAKKIKEIYGVEE
jgi:hypothetical protein